MRILWNNLGLIIKRVLPIVFLSMLILILYKGDVNKLDKKEKYIVNTCDPSDLVILHTVSFDDNVEEIRNEIFYGELEELAFVVQAESGNQDELGKRYVADCVLNRVDSDKFPDSIHDVIYQTNPVQFATTIDGSYNKAEYEITEDVFKIALEEYMNRTNSSILYFRTDRYSDSGKSAFVYGDHYFSY